MRAQPWPYPPARASLGRPSGTHHFAYMCPGRRCARIVSNQASITRGLLQRGGAHAAPAARSDDPLLKHIFYVVVEELITEIELLFILRNLLRLPACAGRGRPLAPRDALSLI
ncbi:hypothetical protein EVAR_102995_1 [Eumeta japonica]|uniref:Uncharacterized protein n=1 Tax=Eumeta variegata TaxID=151549 RepID=A0A4C1UR18_EUMVA|nr:hypothetical protein EVAR_102995_1 [Eumeta japonica]